MSSPSNGDGSGPPQMTNDDLLPYLRSIYAALHLGVVTLGVQICLCLYGYSVYSGTPLGLRKHRRPYIAISFVILFLSLIGTVADGLYLGNVLLSNSGNFVQAVNAPEPWYGTVSDVSFVLSNFLGDGLLIYRCYVVWPEWSWIAVILPLSAYLASLGFGLATVAAGHPNVHVAATTVGATWISLSVFINFTATAIISWRLLSVRRRLGELLGPAQVRKYTGALAILIESAFPFTVFGVVAAVLYSNPSLQLRAGVSSVIEIWYCLAALCPQLIIFRVTTGASFTSDFTTDVQSELPPLEFAEYSSVHVPVPKSGSTISDTTSGYR